MEFSTEEKRFLQSLGRTEYGRDLVNVLNKAKEFYSSIEGIDGSKDYGAQVEGRKLFGVFIEDLVKTITTQKHRINPKEPDDFT